jgi:threonyl-tRNA synthetase
VRVLPIADAHLEYAGSVAARFQAAGVRASCDGRSETMGYKVRSGTLDKVPYLLIVGDREVGNGTVSVRSHDRGDEGAVPVADVLERIIGEIKARQLPSGFQPPPAQP